MGLETGTRIEDLVDTNPLGSDPKNQGDDHLRLIKTCVQGSFPSLGSGQVTLTTDEINKALTPTTILTPLVGDIVEWDGAAWVNVTPVVPDTFPAVFTAQYSQVEGRGSSGSFSLHYTNTDVDTITASGLALSENDTTEGYYFEAVERCFITMTYYFAGQVGNVSGTTLKRVGLLVNGNPASSFNGLSSGALMMSETATDFGGMNGSFSGVVEVGDRLQFIYSVQPMDAQAGGNLTVSVQEIAP